jgi:4-amino-4-deoxy-L-arabinose transferase-like glycosyltransferase
VGENNAKLNTAGFVSREGFGLPLLIAVGAGLALRLLVVAFVYQGFLDPGRDHWEFGYEAGHVASSIATGGGFANPIWRGATGPTALVAPVLPYLISAVFRISGVYTKASALVLLTLNSLFSALTCFPVFFVAQRSFGLRTAKWATWMWAFFPYAVYFSADNMWNHSFMALLLALLFLFAQHLESRDHVSAWMGFGLLSGFSALVRPAILYTLPFLGGWACYRLARHGKHWMKAATVGALAVFITILPWLVRNYLAFRRPVFLQDNFWMEVCVGNLGNARHWWNGGVHPCDSVTEMHEYQRLGETGYLAEKRRQALAFITNNPGTYVLRSIRRVVFMWTGYWSMNRDYLREEPLDPANILFLTSFTVLALGGLYRAFRKVPQTAMPYFLVLITFLDVYYLTHPDPGFRHPLDPLLVILASYLLASRFSSSRGSRAEPVAAAE